MKAEQIPIQKMEERKAQIQSKKTLLDEFIKYVEDIKKDVLPNRTERSLRELKVARGDDSVNLTLDKNIAQPGSYQFQVKSLARKSSVFTNGVEDPNKTYLGVGYLQYYLPNGESREIYIDPENSSMNGIAKLINEDPTNGMYATVVNDGINEDEPYRLIIALKDTGDKNKATFPYLYLVDGEEDLYVDQEREGRDAVISLDGFEIEVPENQVANILPGVNIDLLKPGEEFTLEIVEDTAKIADKVQALVDHINKVLEFINTQNDLDENSNTRTTLGGDITLQTMETRIRNTIFQPIPTSMGWKRIGDLGITFKRDGLLNFDRDKFESSLKKDYKSSAQILIGRLTEQGNINGFINNVFDVADNSLKSPSGTLHVRRQGFTSNISQIDKRIADKQRHIEQKEKNLKTKFARLEETMSEIKTQGQGLAGLANQGVNPVQQLG